MISNAPRLCAPYREAPPVAPRPYQTLLCPDESDALSSRLEASAPSVLCVNSPSRRLKETWAQAGFLQVVAGLAIEASSVPAPFSKVVL